MFRHRFYGQVSPSQWREMAKHLESPPEDELWETAKQIVVAQGNRSEGVRP